MKTICHDDIVIDGDDEGQNDHGDTNSHGTRQHLHPDGKGADLYYYGLMVNQNTQWQILIPAPAQTDPELLP